MFLTKMTNEMSLFVAAFILIAIFFLSGEPFLPHLI